jgi:tetratricopeptide (TPR) repeat protein
MKADGESKMFAFVSEVARDFWAASALEQTGFVLSLAGVSTVLGVIFSAFRLRNNRSLIDELRRDAAASALERDTAERHAAAERERAQDWMPDRWLHLAQAARQEGDEEHGVEILMEGFDRLRIPLARTTLALAGHHLSQIVGSDPLAHLADGERLARLSALLDPDDTDAAFLVEDAELARTNGDLEAITSLPGSFLPGDAEGVRSTINAINSKAQDFHELGLYRLALRLFRRSLLLARRAELMPDYLGQLIRYKIAESLVHCGLYQEALDTISDLIAIQEDALPSSDEELFRSRIIQAHAVQGLGDPTRALELMTRAIEAFAPVAGNDHPYTLAARIQMICCLLSVGEASQALGASIALLPDVIRVYGKQHPNTLGARHQEACALAMVGESHKAFGRVGLLLEDHRDILGIDHPGTLPTRQLEAELLFELGEHDTAIARMTELCEVVDRVLGPRHPYNKMVEEVRAWFQTERESITNRTQSTTHSE